MMDRPRGFSFLLILLLGIVGIFILILLGLWYDHITGTNTFIQALIFGGTVLITVVLIILLLGLIGLRLFLKKGLLPKFFMLPLSFLVSGFLPFVVNLGMRFGVEDEQLKRGYIYLVNRMMGKKGYHVEGKDLLVLIPHCLQKATCPHRVIFDVDNCRKCGGCQVEDLLKLKEKKGFHLAIVTGGTRARQVVRELRPKGIVAIACERDLMSGMKDVFPVPILGVINLRPHGPCFNTEVPLQEVEKAIDRFMGVTDD